MTEEPFDIDNIDIEEEMIRHDIEEEEQAEEEAREQELSKKAIANRKILNAKNLGLDLDLLVESDRTLYKFRMGTIQYSGYVVYKFDNDAYIFSVLCDGETTRKLKKIRLSEVVQNKD